MKYVPRRDLLLSITIWSSILLMVGAGLTPLIIKGAGLIGGSILLLICFTIAGLVAWIWLGTYYVLDDYGLTARSGPFKTFIAYERITKLEPIRSWLSGFATSSRRIEINFGKYDSIHISPLEQEAFLNELKKRTPHLAH